VIADLIKFGKTHHGWLGVHIQSVDSDIAENLGLKDQHGALVADVTPGGPAAKAGIKPGDVIIRFDGKDVAAMHRLPRMVAETAVGKEVEVTVLRDGKRVDLKLVLGELPDENAKDQGKGKDKIVPKKDNGQTLVNGLGIAVAPLTQPLRERFDLTPDAKGVVVTDVNPDGPAAEKGLHAGDLIVEASQEAIKVPSDLTSKVDAARKAGHKSILVLVQSEGALHFVPIRIDTDDKGGKGKNKDSGE
jgi:serine protease Do